MGNGRVIWALPLVALNKNSKIPSLSWKRLGLRSSKYSLLSLEKIWISPIFIPVGFGTGSHLIKLVAGSTSLFSLRFRNLKDH